MNWQFWLKTILYRYTPGGYGYMRRLSSELDPDFQFSRDKHPVREKHHGKGGWGEGQRDGMTYRDYTDYEEYLTHQKQKLDEMLKIKGGFSNQDIFQYRTNFYRRFRHLKGLLPTDARILCCGARQGTEVEVFRDLGFAQAYGIDLNPGPDNPLVKPGDFMNLEEDDASVDLIYSNCLDHSFDLPAMLAEHARVIKDQGFVLYDIAADEESAAGVFESVTWESSTQILNLLLNRYKKVVRAQNDGNWVWFLLQQPFRGDR